MMRLGKNKRWIELVTFMVIAASLCPNAVLARDNQVTPRGCETVLRPWSRAREAAFTGLLQRYLALRPDKREARRGLLALKISAQEYPQLIKAYRKNLRQEGKTNRVALAQLVQAQGKYHYNSDFEELLVLLLADPCLKVKKAAFDVVEKVLAAGQIPGARPVRCMIKRLRDSLCQREAAGVLDRIIEDGHIYYILRAVDLDYLNGMNGDSRIDEELVEIFLGGLESADDNLRRVSVAVLGNVAYISEESGKELVTAEQFQFIITRFASLIHDPNYNVRRAAVYQLGRICDEENADKVMKELLKRLDKERHNPVLCGMVLEAIYGVGEFVEDEGLKTGILRRLNKILRGELDETDDDFAKKQNVKRKALRVFSLFPERREAWDVFMQYLNDPDPELRRSVVEDLDEFGLEELETIFYICEYILLAEDEEGMVVAEAITLLGRLARLCWRQGRQEDFEKIRKLLGTKRKSLSKDRPEDFYGSLSLDYFLDLFNLYDQDRDQVADVVMKSAGSILSVENTKGVMAQYFSLFARYGVDFDGEDSYACGSSVHALIKSNMTVAKFGTLPVWQKHELRHKMLHDVGLAYKEAEFFSRLEDVISIKFYEYLVGNIPADGALREYMDFQISKMRGVEFMGYSNYAYGAQDYEFDWFLRRILDEPVTGDWLGRIKVILTEVEEEYGIRVLEICEGDLDYQRVVDEEGTVIGQFVRNYFGYVDEYAAKFDGGQEGIRNVERAFAALNFMRLKKILDIDLRGRIRDGMRDCFGGHFEGRVAEFVEAAITDNWAAFEAVPEDKMRDAPSVLWMSVLQEIAVRRDEVFAGIPAEEEKKIMGNLRVTSVPLFMTESFRAGTGQARQLPVLNGGLAGGVPEAGRGIREEDFVRAEV